MADCMVACDVAATRTAAGPGAAQACGGFFFNAALRRCHLIGACPIGAWTCIHDEALQSLQGTGIGPWTLYLSAEPSRWNSTGCPVGAAPSPAAG